MITKLQDLCALFPLYEAYDDIGTGDALRIDLRKNLFQCIAVSLDGAIGYGNPFIGIFIDETRVVIGKHTCGPLEGT
jgi:hypothetical protein